MSHRNFRRAAISFVGLVATFVPTGAMAEISAEGKATLPATSSNYYDLAPCSSTKNSFCVESFVIDLNNDGTFETLPVSSNISMHVWLFNLQYDMPGLGWEILVDGKQELAPTIPAGTRARVRINTDQFQPTANLLTEARIEAFSVAYDANRWLTSVDFVTMPYTFALNCTSDQECATSKSQTDFASYAQGTMFWNDPSPTTQAQHDMWVSTNASTIYELQFNRTELTWSVILVAPMTKKDGSPNVIVYETFIPDTAIAYSYGTTPDLLGKYLSVTRMDFDEVREVKATITRVTTPVSGVLISIPDIRIFGKTVKKSAVTESSSGTYSTRPKILIKPTVTILPAPKNVAATTKNSVTRLTGRPVSGALSYQAMCSRGASVVTSQQSSVPLATVKLTSKGKWRCQLRARGKLAGNWSSPITVKV